MSDERPPWVPYCIEDGTDLRHYLGSAGAILDKARWVARELNSPGLLAQVDQTSAHIARKRDDQLGGADDE